MKLLNVGLGNTVIVERVLAVVEPESAPIKRMIQSARDSEHLIDVTHGKKTRAALILDSGHIVLSTKTAETLVERISTDAATYVNRED